MSTKNLSKTIIEGGRRKGNKWDRRNSHAEERTRVKNYLKEVTLDPENYEEYDVEPIQHIYKGFDDKIGPIYRWLNSQIGRPWNDVRSDISNTFDVRTTAGRHIVFDHMLSSVEVTPNVRLHYHSNPDDPTTSYFKYDFYVDDEGILQKKRYIGRRHHDKIPPFDTNQLANWLNGRVVGQVGGKFFWFVPVGKCKKHKRIYREHIWKTIWGYPPRHIYYYGNYGLQWQYLYEEIVFKKDSLGREIWEDGQRIEIGREKIWKDGRKPFLRQGHKLNKEDLEYWNKLHDYYKTKILQESPNYPEELKPKDNRYY